jgi:transglutaminase-like putative cysteine protease
VKLTINHETRYTYDAPVRSSTQYLRLTPRTSERQKVIEWRVEAPQKPVQTLDGYGNVLHVLTLDKPVHAIRIGAIGVIETTPVEDAADPVPLSPLVFTRGTLLTKPDAALTQLAEGFRRRAGSLAGLRDLAIAILRQMPFKPGETIVSSTAADAFALGSGVCQDHAHVFIACCRVLGIPARYVSGYVYSPGHADMHISSHAWAEAWVVDRWRSFDISNSCPAGESHVKLAIGADYYDACPIRGTRIGGGTETMTAAAYVSAEQ